MVLTILSRNRMKSEFTERNDGEDMETGMKTLTPDLAERKRTLKDICRNHPQWKIRIALAAVLFIAAVGVLGGTIGLLIGILLRWMESWLLLEAPYALRVCLFSVDCPSRIRQNIGVRFRIPAMQTHHCCWAKIPWSMLFGG